MATDLTVVLEDKPGTLAKLGETLGQAGIDILGGCGVTNAGEGVVHILVDDAAATRKTLGSAGLNVRDERPVMLIPVADQPGELGKLARRIANAGVNIELLYLTTDRQLVLGVDNLEKAKAALPK